jgi:hypothetical protein
MHPGPFAAYLGDALDTQLPVAQPDRMSSISLEDAAINDQLR